MVFEGWLGVAAPEGQGSSAEDVLGSSLPFCGPCFRIVNGMHGRKHTGRRPVGPVQAAAAGCN